MMVAADDSSRTFPYKPGDTFGDYCLQEKLGRITFKAIRETDKKIVAIKIIHKSSENVQQLYETEVRAFDLTKDILGVLHLFDNGIFNENFYIATEFISKETLRDELERHLGGMSIEEVLLTFTPIANAIDQIHERNIIHRDLTPRNILLKYANGKYQPLITDFGLAKFVEQSKSYETENVSGTPGYIPPEGWRLTNQQTSANDIFSFGVMLYEAFEGKPPFEKLAQAPTYPVPYPGLARRNTKSDGIVDLLLWVLSEEQNERPRTAMEIIELIRKVDSADESDRKWIGRKFQRYVVQDVFGKKKPNPALLAKDVIDGKWAVLKAFDQNILKVKQDYEAMFHGSRSLEAGNGVLIPKSFEDDEKFFLVTDYYRGGTLRDLLTEKPRTLGSAEFLELFAKIAKSIDYFHRKRIIHRDIKPENIVFSVLDGKITPYLTDFGIAKKLSETTSSLHTKTIIGTFQYMAPESWGSNAGQTRAVDIYSFGIMLYEMMEGKVPFDGESPEQIMRQHIESPVPAMKNTRKIYGETAEAIIRRSLDKEASKRPKSAVKLVNDIKKAGKKYETKKGIISDDSASRSTGLRQSRDKRTSVSSKGYVWLTALFFLLLSGIGLPQILSGTYSTPTLTEINIATFSPTYTITNTYIPRSTRTATFIPSYTPIPAKLTTNTNCRYGPNSSTFGVLERAPYETDVLVLGKSNQNGDWFLISWINLFGTRRECWIVAKSLDLTSDQVASIPITSTPAVLAPSVTPSSTNRNGSVGNTSTVPNTAVPPAATNTPRPPIATDTPISPAATNTPKPPAATNTSVPATATVCTPPNNPVRCP